MPDALLGDEAFARMLHHRAGGVSAGEPLEPPIVLASTFSLPGTPDPAHYQYGRFGNPTWSALEEALDLLEQARTTVFPSGMAAVAAALLTQLSPGDRVLLPSDGYYTTRLLAEQFLEPFGIHAESTATNNYALHDFGGYAVVYLETPSNPGLDLCDIADVAARAHRAGARVVADNTTMTPIGQRPLELGVDVVVSSDTKALSGHSDVVLGHTATRDDDLNDRLRKWRMLAGGVPGPFEAWLVHRGLESLEVRFERMCLTSSILAERLLEHPAVEAVTYPGLPTHPDHALAQRQMERSGALLEVTLRSAPAAEEFIGRSELIAAATSFGGIYTTAERRARWGDAVAEGSVRLSVGCEPTEALWADLKRALDGSTA